MMMRRELLGRTASKANASICLVLALLFSGCLRNHPRATPQAISAKVGFERSFLLWKLDDGMTVQAMTGVCSKKHVRPELASLCNEIDRRRKLETEVAQGYLFVLYGQKALSFPAFPEAPVSLASKDGPEFEAAFLEQMMELDTDGVKKARNCISQASQPDILNFCSLLERSRWVELELLQIELCKDQENCEFNPSRQVAQGLVFGSRGASFSTKDSRRFSTAGGPYGPETRAYTQGNHSV
jgi:hypothetical protein